MRSRTVAVALIAFGLTCLSRPASATSITLPVTGGPGIDQGAICASGNSCPATPAFTLTGNAAVNGSFVYDNVINTVSFTLNNIVPVSFVGAPFPQLAPGLFSATGIPVISIPLGGGDGATYLSTSFYDRQHAGGERTHLRRQHGRGPVRLLPRAGRLDGHRRRQELQCFYDLQRERA